MKRTGETSLKPEAKERYREHRRITRLARSALIYGVLQVVIFTWVTRSPEVRRDLEGGLAEAAVVLVQFFGLMAVFYSTRLRDMGVPSLAAPLLLWAAILGAAVVLLVPRPEETGALWLRAALGAQLVLALGFAIATARAWRRAKARARGGTESQ